MNASSQKIGLYRFYVKCYRGYRGSTKLGKENSIHNLGFVKHKRHLEDNVNF